MSSPMYVHMYIYCDDLITYILREAAQKIRVLLLMAGTLRPYPPPPRALLPGFYFFFFFFILKKSRTGFWLFFPKDAY